MRKIGEVVLGSTGTISFTSIPAEYNFLILYCSIFGDSTSDNYMYSLRVNGSSVAVKTRMLYAQGSSIMGFDTNGDQFSIAGAGSSRRARTAVEVVITGKYSSAPMIFTKSGGPSTTGSSNYDLRNAGTIYANSVPVNSITFAGDLTAGSIVTLYGLL